MTSSTHHQDAEFEAILEEFILCSERGEGPSPESYLRRYPKYSAPLREFFEHWTFMNRELEVERREIQPSVPPSNGNSSSRPSPNRTIGSFRILDEIGSGSQGVVYRAEQHGTSRIVALKVMKDLFASESERRRFEREVQLAARLRHSNIVSVFEYGRADGRDFFAMEYVDGQPLDVCLSERTHSVRETVELFLQVCDAVAYAHQQGVIHRDLKPSNILVDKDQQVRILDFGLAKLVGPEAALADFGVTQLGSFAGTWLYASPEQVARDDTPVDVRSDVYTLGVILFEMLTDNLPYGETVSSKDDLARTILGDRRIAAESIRRDVPAELSIILLVALKRSPEARYQSASALAQDLRRFLAGEIIEAKRDSRWYLLRKTVQYYRWPALFIAGAALVLVAFSATVTVLYATARQAQATAEARTTAARAGQVHMVGSLERFQQLANILAYLQEKHPDLVVVQRLKRSAVEIPGDLHKEIAAAPAELFAQQPASFGVTPKCRDWLQAHEPTMARLGLFVANSRLTVRSSSPAEENWLLRSVPTDLALLETACGLFVAQALETDNNATVSLSHLDTARSVALDLADGASIFHKGSSMVCRDRIYRAYLVLLQQAATHDASVDGFADWLSIDPPLPALASAMLTERMKVLQLLEASTVATVPGEQGRLNLAYLDRHTGGLYSALGYMTEEYRSLVSTLRTADVIAALDRIMDDRIDDSKEPAPVLHLLAPVLPSLAAARAKVHEFEALRRTSALACELCQFWQSQRAWPDDLTKVNAAIEDPVSQRRFGYVVSSNAAQIYSLNIDGEFDHYCWGNWGDRDTDVLLFSTILASD